MQFTGKTVEEATELGLKELDLTIENAEIEVIEEPVKGIFGKLKGKAVVEINPKKQQSNFEKAVEFVQNILDKMGINAKAKLDEEKENVTVEIIAEKSSSIIGYRGEILDAIQTLTSAVANIGNKEYIKIVVDCENYRGKREETLINLAHKLENKATDMRREVLLEPMSPFERRIIHTALAESKTVTTKSEGKEPNRYVIIVPNDKDEYARPYNAGRNNFDKKGDRSDFKKTKKHSNYDKKKSGTNSGEKRKSSTSFGTFLGNSFKDNF